MRENDGMNEKQSGRDQDSSQLRASAKLASENVTSEERAHSHEPKFTSFSSSADAHALGPEDEPLRQLMADVSQHRLGTAISSHTSEFCIEEKRAAHSSSR